MSPAFLFLDLLVLVVGLPFVWTLRDMAPATAGSAALVLRTTGSGAGSAEAIPQRIEERRLMREMLRRWHELCPADIATLDAVQAAPDAQIATIEGSPTNLFWSALAGLGWAHRTALPESIRRSGIPSEIFALTADGARLLPDFRRRYDLVFGTSYAPAAPAPRGGSLADRFQ
jgi:hypothetical protein